MKMNCSNWMRFLIIAEAIILGAGIGTAIGLLVVNWVYLWPIAFGIGYAVFPFANSIKHVRGHFLIPETVTTNKVMLQIIAHVCSLSRLTFYDPLNFSAFDYFCYTTPTLKANWDDLFVYLYKIIDADNNDKLKNNFEELAISIDSLDNKDIHIADFAALIKRIDNRVFNCNSYNKEEMEIELVLTVHDFVITQLDDPAVKATNKL